MNSITLKRRSIFKLLLSSSIHNSKGNSLIMVMIGLGLMAIMSLAMSSMISNLNRETQRLNQKMAILQLQTEITSILMNKDKCQVNFGAGALDLSGVPATPTPTSSGYTNSRRNIVELRDGSAAASPLILSAGTSISNILGVQVEQMDFRNWYNPSPDNYRADFVVTLKSNAGPIAPLQVRNIRFLTSGPIAAKNLIYCGAPGKGSASLGPVIPTNTWSIPAASAGASNPTFNLALPANAVAASISGTCFLSSQNGASTLAVQLKDAANSVLQTINICGYWGVSIDQTGGTIGSASFPIPVGVVMLTIVGNLSTDGVWTGVGGSNSITYSGEVLVDDLF